MTNPPGDRQSVAFRGATDADHWDGDLEAVGGRVSQADDVSQVVLPDEFEEHGWDAGREGPKSLEEAQAALAARIADPGAPDGPDVAGAYDWDR